MKSTAVCYAVVLGLGVALGSGVRIVNAEQSPPKESKGFHTTKTQVVDLGPEIQGMAGRELRLRVLTIEPGGYIGIHSHKDRPAVVYFLQGTDTVISADGTEKQFHAGDTSYATKDTTHWHRNGGKDTVVLIAVDVFHKTK
jgi:quercetin dioxygenase-like cupin family protein